jgi:hypothetical protein
MVLELGVMKSIPEIEAAEGVLMAVMARTARRKSV